MSQPGSITHWVHRLKEGDSTAAQQLWENYFPRLVALARAKLRGARRRAEDEEDAVLSAFDSFCRGAVQGRFPKLTDRDDLWQLLVVITARKAYDLSEREGRLKRGGGKVRGDSVFEGPASEAGDGWERFVGAEPTPEFAAQAAEEYQRLLDRLGDDELRKIAVWKMEGHTSDEIAVRLGCSMPTIERRLLLIRKTWAADADAKASGDQSGKASS